MLRGTRRCAMRKLYIVRLTKQERVELQSVVKKLKGTGQKVRRAQILLKADAEGPNWSDESLRTFPPGIDLCTGEHPTFAAIQGLTSINGCPTRVRKPKSSQALSGSRRLSRAGRGPSSGSDSGWSSGASKRRSTGSSARGRRWRSC